MLKVTAGRRSRPSHPIHFSSSLHAAPPYCSRPPILLLPLFRSLSHLPPTSLLRTLTHKNPPSHECELYLVLWKDTRRTKAVRFHFLFHFFIFVSLLLLLLTLLASPRTRSLLTFLSRVQHIYIYIFLALLKNKGL